MSGVPKKFGLIGAAGFIAPRHMRAVKDTGNRLVAAIDPSDSVGVIDSYAPGARFFTEIERFDRHLEKLRRRDDGEAVDYVSICSPNYLHDAHVRMALRLHAHAICEKPLVINPWNLDQLSELESEFGRKVFTVLQLRTMPAMLALKQTLLSVRPERADVELTYITRRGRWYDVSWKGDEARSGGVAMNIGIHFFDLMIWLFGSVQAVAVHLRETRRMGGVLELEGARVRWFLSVCEEDLPASVREAGGYAHRSMTLNGEEMDFSANFAELHTRVYEDILAGKGWGIADARPSIQAVYDIRHAELQAPGADAHPAMQKS
jgi:UDP-N-acetyl-2-amino-2-deoxyglucuronate dehydrogenase